MDAEMRYCFDLDGTLCVGGETGDYRGAMPIPRRIALVRKLHDEGHYIIIDTARGTDTKQEWAEFTRDQLDRWGCPFHELHVGRKPFAHFYIDDRATNAHDYFGGTD